MAKDQSYLFDEPPPSRDTTARIVSGTSPDTSGDIGTEPAPFRPLAVRMRPRTISEIVGQEHLVGEGCLLPRLVATDSFGSILLYGPPGCGKTTIAEVIANETRSHCIRLNAVLSNVAELREILAYARRNPQRRTLLFIDEIHRFNKAQQDLLLPDVEQGNVRLIGATTHNPGFYIIPPLVSRSHLFRLEPLPEEAIARLLKRALEDGERGLGSRQCVADVKVLADLARLCGGDLRRALNSLETLVLGLQVGQPLTQADVEIFARERRIRYDADEDEHYDTISAFIKSVRGSDPDAALYWMAKMLLGGEDPRFIARRLVILASEDIGLADSRGLQIAVSAFQAVDMVGLPEAEYALAHATVFLATCPKSNTAGMALHKAKAHIQEYGVQSVPKSLRDTGGNVSKAMGHGKGYLYSHDYPEAISGQEYMERPIQFFHPGSNGAEGAIAERLAHWRARKAAMPNS
ncbi:MAG: replication-associated recombination protein A [Verrucomicrobiota bacterium]|nr:replication-associated recombination protein A [Verrucomicrobiota bacterium]